MLWQMWTRYPHKEARLIYVGPFPRRTTLFDNISSCKHIILGSNKAKLNDQPQEKHSVLENRSHEVFPCLCHSVLAFRLYTTTVGQGSEMALFLGAGKETQPEYFVERLSFPRI